MDGHLVGPQYIDEFFNAFLPCDVPSDWNERLRAKTFFDFRCDDSELGCRFVRRWINRWNRCLIDDKERSLVVDEADDVEWPHGSAPHINVCAYPPYQAQLPSNIQLLIQCKSQYAADSFRVFDRIKRYRAGKLPQSVVEQLAELVGCMEKLESWQYRIHIFSVLVCGYTARFFRWDHAGCIFTEPIYYTEDSTKFMEFFYRFESLRAEERGFDPRFVILKPVPDKWCQTWEHTRQLDHEHTLQEAAKRGRGNDAPSRPSAELQISSREGKELKLLANVHVKQRDSLFGPATREMPVWDGASCDMRYYKDTWAFVESNDDKSSPKLEFEILEDLASVNEVPTLVAGGRLPFTTRTAEFLPAIWNQIKDNRKPITRKLAFALTKHVPERLESFRSYGELMKVVHDACIAHKKAYNLGYLHCDIRPDNIAILRSRDGRNVRGLLINWERANGTAAGQLDPHVKNDWTFASALRCRNPKKEHLVQDDVESFVHVTTYFSIRYCTPLSLTEEDLVELFSKVYASSEGTPDWLPKASMFLMEGYIFRGKEKLELVCQPLADWINASMPGCAYWIQKGLNPERRFRKSRAITHAALEENWLAFSQNYNVDIWGEVRPHDNLPSIQRLMSGTAQSQDEDDSEEEDEVWVPDGVRYFIESDEEELVERLRLREPDEEEEAPPPLKQDEPPVILMSWKEYCDQTCRFPGFSEDEHDGVLMDKAGWASIYFRKRKRTQPEEDLWSDEGEGPPPTPREHTNLHLESSRASKRAKLAR